MPQKEGQPEEAGATFRLPFFAVVVVVVGVAGVVDVAVLHWDAIKYIAVKVSTFL